MEIGRCEVVDRSSGLPNKKNALPVTCATPVLSKMGQLRPKLLERCQPLTWPHILNLVWIGCIGNVRRKQPSNFVAVPLIMCLRKVGYRISNFAAAARMDVGHFVSFSHCFHCSLHCWFTPTRSFYVSFVLVNHLHSLQQELSYRKQIARQLRTQYVEGTHRPKYHTVSWKGKSKGKGLDTCYSATYMSQTRDQQRFTIS